MMRVVGCLALALVAAFLALATAPAAQADPGVRGDYDGDTKADLAVWRGSYLGDPEPAVWWIWKSSGGFDVRTWGVAGHLYWDRPLPRDYDGDTKADLAVWRCWQQYQCPSVWWIWKSSGGFDVRAWGQWRDSAVPADYDGDTKADVAVYRPDYGVDTGTWWIWKSSGGFDVRTWGEDYDHPVPADYDGDTKAELAVWRSCWPGPCPGVWWIWKSTGGFDVRQWGETRVWGDDTTPMPDPDVPLPQDYDGDTKADLAVWRCPWSDCTAATWWIWKSSGGFDVRQWGQDGDRPVPADYDGDTKADLAVWRSSTGVWWIWKSSGGFDVRQWGQSGDQPVP